MVMFSVVDVFSETSKDKTTKNLKQNLETLEESTRKLHLLDGIDPIVPFVLGRQEEDVRLVHRTLGVEDKLELREPEQKFRFQFGNLFS